MEPDYDQLDIFLAELKEMALAMPHLRIGQLLSNLDTWTRARTSVDLFYIPNERLLAAMKGMNRARLDYEPKLAGWDVT